MIDAPSPQPAMTKQQQAVTGLLVDEKNGSDSPLHAYKNLVVGDKGYLFLIWFEILQLLFSNIPGLLGLLLRSIFFRGLFSAAPKRLALGRSISLRQPQKISLGQGIILDDFVTLDTRGNSSSIQLGDRTTIGRFTTLVAKNGHIALGKAVNVGSYCRLGTQTSITIGDSTLIAAYCYIGPGNHKRGDGSKSLIEEEMELKSGVVIGSQVWIGSHCTIMDGVTIGDGAIIGAHSFVKSDIPANTTAAGVPARVIKN